MPKFAKASLALTPILALILTSSVPEEKYVAKHRDFLDGTSHWLQKSGWDLNFL